MFVSYVRDQCADNADVDKDQVETIVLIELGELGNILCSFQYRRDLVC